MCSSAHVAGPKHEDLDMADRSVTFTGIRFENPFLLSSAPPTESESNIQRAFEAGGGGGVCKTIGLYPVVNASIMAGSGSDKELRNWQLLTKACQTAGADGIECNFSCPHMDRKDMGSNIGKDEGLCSVVTEAVKEVATVPVWTKLTPATQDIVVEAAACFRGGADAIVSSNTFPSLPIIDPETLEFEINVDGFVSSGGLGGPAILPLSLANMARMTQAFPDKAFSGIGGVSDFAQALSFFLLGCGTLQVFTAAMLDQAVG